MIVRNELDWHSHHRGALDEIKRLWMKGADCLDDDLELDGLSGIRWAFAVAKSFATWVDHLQVALHPRFFSSLHS